jgi:hypothetical protein
MSKYEESSDDIHLIFNECLIKAGLNDVVNVKCVCDNRQKKITNLVKCTPLVKFISSNTDIVISVNEKVFDQLEDWQKHMVAEEAIAGISFDFEKDKLVTNKKDVQTHSGFVRNYGWPKYEVLCESIKTIYNKEQEEEAETETV